MSNYPPNVTDSMLPGNGPSSIDNEELFELYADTVTSYLGVPPPSAGWEQWLEAEMWQCYEADHKAWFAADVINERYEEELFLMKDDHNYRTPGITDKAYIAVLTQTEVSK